MTLANGTHRRDRRGEERPPIRQLTDLCAEGLRGMFDPKRGLFCYRAIRHEEGLRNEGHSLRYTIISLLGLHRYGKHGGISILDIPAAVPPLFEEARSIDNIGDLGLLLWLCASASPGHLERAWTEFRVDTAMQRYADARDGRTIELSWFLSGLSHAALAGARDLPRLGETSRSALERLAENHGGKGLFRHMRISTPKGIVRGWIGNFADQVYPIYALARLYQAFGEERALALSLACAEKICSLQGPMGQWWWHYDTAGGKVVGQYPVYSVHQDGMAPMALFAAGEASGRNLEKAITLGFRWIEGSNELGAEMIDPGRNVIWRCFYRAQHRLFASGLLSMVARSGRIREYRDLRIRYECRPYHLGWLLYAFPDRSRSGLAG